MHRGRTARFEFTSCMCFFSFNIYIYYIFDTVLGAKGQESLGVLIFISLIQNKVCTILHQKVANAVGLKSNENFLHAHNPVLSPFVHINI